MTRRRSTRAALVIAACNAAPLLQAAPNYTWTTPTNASFSVGPWSPSTPSWGGGISVGLTFTNSIGAPYTATNDLGGPFELNTLTFNAADNRAITLANAPGNELYFSFFSSPSITGNGAVTATLAGRTLLGLPVPVSGIGSFTISGTMTGLYGFTFTGAAQNVLISSANLNSGTTTLNSGTLSIANNNALGSGTLVIAGGTLRNPNPGSTLPNIVTLNNRVTLSGPLTYNAPALADLALTGSIGGTGSIVISGAGTLRLSNASNSFTGGVTFNSGTTSYNSRLIYSSNQGIGTGSANFIGPGKGELIFNGINSTTIPQVNVQSTATAILTGGMDLSTLNVGSLSGGGTIVLGEFSNGGTVNLAGTTNTNTGPISFFSGVTKFGSAATLGNASTLLFQGGTILPTSGWSNAVPVVLSDYTAINTPALTTSILTTGISLDPSALNDALLKNGAGTLVLQGNTRSRLIVNAGTLLLGTNGSITYVGASPAVTINSQATLSLQDVGAGNRLPDNSTISLAGGTVLNSGTLLETVGTLSLAANTRNAINSGIRDDVSTQLTFAALSRSSGSVAYFIGHDMGGSNEVLFGTAPSGSLTPGGNGALGTPTVNILRGAFVVDNEGDPFGALFTALATYDPVNGVRRLQESEFVSTINSGSNVLNNVNLLATANLSAPTTINCLAHGTVTGNTTLTINSGMLLFANVNVSTLAIGDGVINGGLITSVITGTSLTTSGIVDLSGANVYTGPTTFAGTTNSRASAIVPDASTVYVDGTWNLNGNTETIAALTQHAVAHDFGAPSSLINLGGGTLIVGANDASSSFAGSIANSGSVTKIGSGILTLSGSSGFTGGLTIQRGTVRAEALPIASSPTNDPNDFSGAVLATTSADAILGTGTIMMAPAAGSTAELRLSRNVGTLTSGSFSSRSILASGAGTSILSTDLDPNHGTPTAAGPRISLPITITNSSLQLSLSSGTLSGLISGSGSITVNNNPVTGEDPQPIVTITNSANSYTGTTTIINGSLYVGGNLAHALGNSSTSVNLGTSATIGYAELGVLASASGFNRLINVGAGQPGSTVALSVRTAGINQFEGTITLGPTALRLFSTSDPMGGGVGTMQMDDNISGTGSLIIGAGFPSSIVFLPVASRTYSGGTTLTDGTLIISGSSAGVPVTSGPLGLGSLIIAGTTLPPTLVGAGTVANPLIVNSDFNVAGAQSLTFSGAATFSGERVININGAPLGLTGPISTSGSLDKDGTGGLRINSSNTFSTGISVFAGSIQFGASQTIATLNMGRAGAFTTTVSLAKGGDKLLRMNNLNIGPGALLDLADNDAILDYTGASPLARIAQLITTGYAGGTWNGVGISSSTAQGIANTTSNPNKTAIGFAEASTLGISSFGGQSVDGSAILMRYTFMGDANLDGLVNALDFNAVASNFGGSNVTWASGDFTFDGQVNTLDFNWIATNFNQPPLPSPALGSLIPEPCLPSFSLLLFWARRRRPRQI